MATERLESDHWYRIAHLRPRLRPELQIHRQRFRGEDWFLLRDPQSQRFVRLHHRVHGLVASFDGVRTLAELRESVNEGHEDPLSEHEVVELLGWLHRSHLLRAEGAADSIALGRLRTDLKRLRRGPLWSRALTPRMHLVDPDPWLDRHVEWLAPLFGRTAFLVWSGLILAACFSLVGHGSDWVAAGQEVLDPDPFQMLGLMVAFVGLKAVHEFAHGAACKFFGRRSGTDGSVPSMGVLWIALLPVPFVDATSAWALPMKSERIWVSLAGMMAEFAIAALAAFVWIGTGPGQIHTVAFHVMFIASATSLLANANPLLRFDAYYVLADAIEVPNLSSRSGEAWKVMVKRIAFGIRSASVPWFSSAERVWLLGYGFASSLFRLFVVFWLLFALVERAFFVGAALAGVGFLAWFVRPLWKGVAYLISGPELGSKRRRAVGVVGAGVSGALLMLFAIPFPETGKALGLWEPRQMSWIFLREEGVMAEVLQAGTPVVEGQALVRLENAEIATRLAQAEAELSATRVRLRQAVGRRPGELRNLQEDIAILAGRKERWAARANALVVRAPFAGTWQPLDLEPLRGAFIKVDPDRPLGLVADLEDALVRAVANQELGPRINAIVDQRLGVELRRFGDAGRTIQGTIERVVPGGSGYLPSRALGMLGGGQLRTEGSDPSGREAAEPFFEFVIRPAEVGALGRTSQGGVERRPRSGERVAIRFALGASPLGVQWWRSFRQLLQRRTAG